MHFKGGLTGDLFKIEHPLQDTFLVLKGCEGIMIRNRLNVLKQQEGGPI